MPVMNASTDAIFSGLPIHSKPLENKSLSRLDTPDINIAAAIYLVHISIAEIKQNIVPTPLLFIKTISFSITSIAFSHNISQ